MADQRAGGFSCLGCVLSFILLMSFFFTIAVVIMAAVMVIYTIYRIVLWLTVPQERLFGAHPISRWSNAYEHGFFLLESRLGILTNTSPGRIFVSVATITMTPILLVNIVFPVFSPVVMLILYLTGLGITFSTTSTLTQPYDWFYSDIVRNTGLGDPSLDYAHDELLKFDDW